MGSSFRLEMHSAFRLLTRKSCTSFEKTPLIRIAFPLMQRPPRGNLRLKPHSLLSNRLALLNCNEIRLAFLYANNQPITANGQHLSLDSFTGWSLVAADTVSGVNQLIWQNARALARLCRGSWMHSWQRLSSSPYIDPIDLQSFADVELTHGVDLDNDGMLGGMTYVSPIGDRCRPTDLRCRGAQQHLFCSLQP